LKERAKKKFSLLRIGNFWKLGALLIAKLRIGKFSLTLSRNGEKMKEDESGKVRLRNLVNDQIRDGSIDTKGCDHFAEIIDVVPSAAGCEDCLKMGDEWVHLRLCLTCGYVGCCDNSKNKHATRHFHKSGHPVIVSYEVNEKWLWCYKDQTVISI
jgi:uncharacterized UBP type Zn finger protein